MALVVKNIYKAFNKPVLKDISFTLNNGESLGFVGSSGVGKSTLFNIIAGLLPADTGSVIMDEVDITGAVGRVGYMTQRDLLLPYYSVLDNVCLPLVIAGLKKSAAQKIAMPLFDTFMISDTQKLKPCNLSIGMRQRASLLRTYLFVTLRANKIMLLDEPFSALDAITKSAMHEWYCKMARRLDLTTILITHDISEAMAMCNKIFVLKNIGGAGSVINGVFDVKNNVDTERLKKDIMDKI